MAEGEMGDTFAFLIDGELSITRRSGGPFQFVATASAGSIIGELAVLLHRPRMATVAAVVPSHVALGSGDVLLRLLDDPHVLQRLRDQTSNRLAHDARPIHATLDGTPIQLRPLLPEDRNGVAAALESASPAFRRRRFFTAARPSQTLIDYLVSLDYIDHFAWLATTGTFGGWGVARYVRDGPHRDRAEVSFSVDEPLQGRGIGTFLMGALAVTACEAGITTMVGHVLEDNAPMRAVFAKAGGASAWDEPGVIRVEVPTDAAAKLIDPSVRAELRSTTHDIVTAATLALMTPA
jgi:CRP-like cAMP-binding protein